MIDIPAYAVSCRHTFRFLAKAELTRIPLLNDVPYAVMMEPHLVVEYYSR